MSTEPVFSFESEAIIHNCTYGICVADTAGFMTRVNKAFEEITGLGSHHFLGLHVEEAVAKKIIDDSSILKVMRRKKPSTASVTTMAGKRLFSTAFPVYDKKEKVIRFATFMRSLDSPCTMKPLDSILSQNTSSVPNPNGIVFDSPAINALVDKIHRLSLFDCPILLSGETGAGKGFFSKMIHDRSPKAQGPFITLNCSAIPGHLIESELFGYEQGAFTGARKEGKIGLFESAHKGTLVLDEVGEIPLESQVKLLRVLEEGAVLRVGAVEERPIDVRIMALTNRDLGQMVSKGLFRSDLFYRLNVVPLSIPPLRERREDIPKLLDYFLSLLNGKYGTHTCLSSGAMEVLINYSWPGNVREMRNLIERFIILGSGTLIRTDDLPGHMKILKGPVVEKGGALSGFLLKQKVGSLKQELESYEKSLLFEVLKRCDKQEDAAEALRISMSTLTRKIRKYRLGKSIRSFQLH